MLKKIVSVIMILTFMLTTAVCVSAQSLKTYVTTKDVFKNYIKNGMFDYVLYSGDDVITDATTAAKEAAADEYVNEGAVSSGVNDFDYKVTLDMTNVKAAFNSLYLLASRVASPELFEQFKASTIRGEFQVTVTYDQQVVPNFKDYVFGQNGFPVPQIFVLNLEKSTLDSNPAVFVFDLNPKNITVPALSNSVVTVQELKDNQNLLDDLFVEMKGLTLTQANKYYNVKAQLTSAYTIITDGTDDYANITYRSDESAAQIKYTKGGGSGGGNGGSLKPSDKPVVGKVIEGSEIEITPELKDGKYYVDVDKIPTPETDTEHAFTGWYEDEELEKRIKGIIEVTDGTKIYAGIKKIPKVTSDAGEYSETEWAHLTEDGLFEVNLDEITVPAEENFVFEGWYDTPSFNKKLSGVINLTQDEIIYPKFVNTKAPSQFISGEHIIYIVGYPDGEVKPNGNITREEIVSALYRLLDPTYRASIETNISSFPDVAINRWSNISISTMANGGYVVGDDKGNFNPAVPITRAEFATLVYRFSYDQTPVETNQFSDISGHWAEEYIKNVANRMYWINGYEDGTFRPDQYISRAEAMTIINRMLVRYGDVDSEYARQWPDLYKTDWYYREVIEATTHNIYERNADGWSETWIGNGMENTKEQATAILDKEYQSMQTKVK